MSEVEDISTDKDKKEEKPEPGSPEDIARFYDKVKSTEEEALTSKHLEWGWKNMGPEDGLALAHVIKNNTTCITLDLFVNELFVDAGVQVAQAMAFNRTLKSLDLQQAQMGPSGGKAMGEVLKTNTSLMNLKMHYNHLGPEGVAYIAEGLKKNNKLTNLDLGDNGMLQAGVEALADMLEVNTRLFRLDCSKNAGLTSKTGVPNDETAKAILIKAGEVHEAKRKAAAKSTPQDKLPFRLILEDSPGQMWSPNGFVNIVKFPKQRRPKNMEKDMM